LPKVTLSDEPKSKESLAALPLSTTQALPLPTINLLSALDKPARVVKFVFKGW